MKILSVKKLTDEKWVNLYAAQFEHNGHNGRWVFASRKQTPHSGNTCDAVIIVAVLLAEGAPARLVVEKEFRIPVGDYVYGLPAGLLEPGESVEETIRREMLEETGLEVTAIRRITPALYSSAGLTDESAALAFVEVRATPGGTAALEASEDLEVLLLDQEQVGRLCADPTLHIDAKAWMAFYLFQQFGRIV